MLDIVTMGLAIGALSVTLARSEIFSPWRSLWIDIWPWFHRLVSCPYCLGHWLSALSIRLWWWERLPVESWNFLVFTWLAITAVAAVVSGVIIKLHTED